MVACLLVAWIYCMKLQGQTTPKMNEAQMMLIFNNKIKIIDERIVDLTWPGGLFEYQEFREIYDNSTDYFSQACEALKNPDFTEQQKIIVGFSMQGSNLSLFLSFAKYTLQLLESSKITQRVFECVVFPTYDWNTIIVENYDNHDIAQFLHSVLQSKDVSDRRKEIIRKEVLTGKAKSYVLDMRHNGRQR